MCFFQIEKNNTINYLIETSCQCSQIVMFNDASVLFFSLAVLFKIFFMVPSVSVLTEFHFLIKSNICQTVIQTSCESRTVSWKLTTKTNCDVQLRTQMLSIQCRLYILYPNPHS